MENQTSTNEVIKNTNSLLREWTVLWCRNSFQRPCPLSSECQMPHHPSPQPPHSWSLCPQLVELFGETLETSSIWVYQKDLAAEVWFPGCHIWPTRGLYSPPLIICIMFLYRKRFNIWKHSPLWHSVGSWVQIQWKKIVLAVQLKTLNFN